METWTGKWKDGPGPLGAADLSIGSRSRRGREKRGIRGQRGSEQLCNTHQCVADHSRRGDSAANCPLRVPKWGGRRDQWDPRNLWTHALGTNASVSHSSGRRVPGGISQPQFSPVDRPTATPMATTCRRQASANGRVDLAQRLHRDAARPRYRRGDASHAPPNAEPSRLPRSRYDVVQGWPDHGVHLPT